MSEAAKHILIEMARQIRTQDNACTADPYFVVQEKVYIYGIDPTYCDDYEIVWTYEGGELLDEEMSLLAEKAYENGEFSFIYDEFEYSMSSLTRTGKRKEWRDVQPFFTREGAERYIRANRHNLREPRVYVDSAHRNYELQAVRQYLADTFASSEEDGDEV